MRGTRERGEPLGSALAVRDRARHQFGGFQSTPPLPADHNDPRRSQSPELLVRSTRAPRQTVPALSYDCLTIMKVYQDLLREKIQPAGGVLQLQSTWGMKQDKDLTNYSQLD